MEKNNDKVLRDRWELIKQIKQGGFGTIYLARDIKSSIETKYIVKQFTFQYSKESKFEAAKKLFAQEAEVLKKLGTHSQIPQIFDYFEEEGNFFLVQQFIDGQNFEEELEVKKQLNELQTKSFLIDVLQILNFVHREKYIHRDIKPSNLIRNNSDNRIYLIDFGIVKEKIKPENIDNRGNSTLTIPWGTPGYMPDEQRLGRPEFCSDIYALGIIAIQALTGKNPSQLEYDRDNNILWHYYLPTDYYHPNFLNIIDKMVCCSLQQRYQSAREVLEDLDNLSSDKIDNSQKNIISDQVNIPIVPDEQKKKNLSLIWILGGLGILTVAVVTSLFVLAKLSSAKFISYENSEYDIAINYPESWTQEDENDFLCPGIIFNSPYENNLDNFRERVNVCVENLAQTLTLNEYTNRVVKEIEQSNLMIEQPKDITLANREGVRVVYQGKDGKKRMEAWTIKNQKAYVITYTAEENQYKKFLGRMEKMIESFQIVSVDERG